MLEPWKYVLASIPGTSHQKVGLGCQDNSACSLMTTADGSPVLVAVASDGAGSAQLAAVGSELACTLFTQEMRELFESGGTARDITREFAQNWLTHFQHRVAVLAESEGLKPRDFACTLLAAVVGTDCGAFIQIGDGAIVIPGQEDPDDYCWVFWPQQQGEYANQTNFATASEAHIWLVHDLIEQRIDEVAVFTDGIQHLALHYQSLTAHSPFFRPVFGWLRLAAAGHLEKFSDALSAYLNSPKVNDYTDDDKTLILATRRLSGDNISEVDLPQDNQADDDEVI
jgi:hypothetical protein